MSLSKGDKIMRNQVGKGHPSIKSGPMLNVYPDSIGETLCDITEFLGKPELENVFQAMYILPSIFNTDIDRGFSVIDYGLNENFATEEDLKSIREKGITFKFDFILNHASVLSEQFQDILINGERSKYKDFFINWNTFWDGLGEMNDNGYIEPENALIEDMFFRKPGLPILKVSMPDGREVPYWNTFYQEVKYGKIDAHDLISAMKIQYRSAEIVANFVNTSLEEGKKPKDIQFGKFDKYKKDIVNLIESKRKYLGQIDLNIKSDQVWEFYEDTLQKLSKYGAKIVRLDAFAYAPKIPGAKNFLNDPGTWVLLEKVRKIADKYELELLPEIHSKYEEKIHEKLSDEGYMTYDFFLPGLIIDAFESQSKDKLVDWIKDIKNKKLRLVNMLGCHDGIPLLDLKGLLSEERIENLIETVVDRGGYVKDLHGKKNMYYQVNATYYSALGEDDKKLLLARAIQMFMPGIPQVWYLDLFAGKNNYEAVEQVGPGGHKEINRTNLSLDDIKKGLKNEVVKEQLKLLKYRNTSQAFGFDAKLTLEDTENHILELIWENNNCRASIRANLKDYSYEISGM